MNTPLSPSDAPRKPAAKPLTSSSPKTQYLILYNFVSAILWVAVLGRVLLLVPLVGFGKTYRGVGNFAKWTQTMAILEIVHSAIGRHPADIKPPFDLSIVTFQIILNCALTNPK
jgi:very-long-chain (3R)-3-hydroxyacyl-CoA dehydratase